MAIVNGYATLPEAKEWVGLTDFVDDDLLEDIVGSVSRFIDGHCGRQFWTTSAGTVRVFDSDDGHFLDIGDASAVTLVKTDDNQDGTYETTWAAGDWQLLPLVTTSPEARPYTEIRSTGNRLFPASIWPGRVGLVQVTGTFGWSTVPVAVNQACRMQVSRILQRRKSPEGVAGFGEFGPVRVGMRLDPDVALLLQPFRIHAVA